jgi:hypothetical protein
MSRTAPVFGLAWLLVSAGAFAAPTASEKALAQSLFEDGRELLKAGKVSEACMKLAESQRLDPGGGTLLNLAICHEREGRLATAATEFEEAIALAVKDQRPEREKLAREHLAAIEPKIPRLTIRGADPAATVTLNGTVLATTALGTPLRVDLGLHVVKVEAPGKVPLTTTVSVVAGEKRTLDLPQLAEAPPPPLPDPMPPVVAPAPPVYAPAQVTPLPPPVYRPMPDLPDPKVEKRTNPWFWTSLALAGIGYATAGVTGYMALQARDDGRGRCVVSRGYCTDQDGIDALGRARTLAWVSTGALAVGSIFTFIALATPSKRTVFVPTLGDGTTALSMTTTF